MLHQQKEVYPAEPAYVQKNKDNCSSHTIKKGEEGPQFLIFNKNKNKRIISEGKGSPSIFENDPEMQQTILQKILQDNSDDDTASSAASSSPPKPEDFQDSQDPYEL